MLISWLELRKPTLEGKVYRIENPLSFFLKKGGVIKLTDGYKIPYNRHNKQDIVGIVMFALHNGIRFGDLQNQWRLDPIKGIIETHQGIKLNLNKAELLDETFLYQIHFSGFELKEKVIVTAGAYIGDTPLFYSSYGARVYGFEPDPTSYDLAVKNMKLNPELSKNIIINNYAVGKDEEIDFPLNPYGSGGSSIYGVKKYKTIKVKSVSISTILKEFNITDPYLLDLDIKGSEFDVIEDASIQNFHKVRIEYSPYLINSPAKSLEYLISKLKDYGFEKIRIYKHNAIRFDLRSHGTLEAER
jgi:FkbM family methyltransferase